MSYKSSAGMFAVLLANCALAVEGPLPKVSEQSMEAALREYSRQTGMQLLYSAEILAGKVAPTTVGRSLTPELALKTLLAGSGLRYSFLNSRTVALQPPLHTESVDAIRLAQSSSDDSGPPATYIDDAEPTSSSAGIPQVLVKGTRSLNADIERTRDDVRPYVIITREAIEKSNAADVGQLLQSVTSNYVALPNSRVFSPGAGVGNFSQIALRGLSAAETLILVDGRRITSLKSETQELQSDLNSIPLAQIERIEVLPSSASSIYGGNATGGVVNVILRRDYKGFESRVSFGDQFNGGGATRTISVLGGRGFNSGKTSIAFGASYSDQDQLQAKDVNYISSMRKAIQENLINRVPQTYYNRGSPARGATTNVSSVASFGIVPEGTPGATCIPGLFCFASVAPELTLKPQFGGASLGSSITSVPVNYAGIQSDAGAGLIANAGRYNLDFANGEQLGGGKLAAVRGGPRVGTINFTLRQKVTSNLDSFVDVSLARNDQFFSGNSLNTQFYLPATSDANPFLQDIYVNAPLDARGDIMRTRADSSRALLGLRFDFAKHWSIALDYSFSNAIVRQSRPPTLFSSLLGSEIENGAINVLQDPSNYTAALSAYTVPLDSLSPTKSRANDLSLRLAGSLFSMRAGEVALSMTVEDRNQRYDPYTAVSYFDFDSALTYRVSEGSSRSQSVYGELRVPLVSHLNSMKFAEMLELQLAARLDKYRQRASFEVTAPDQPQVVRTFDSTDPSISVRFKPINDLMFRGSFGSGFLPPYLSQIQTRPTEIQTYMLFDPKRGGEPVSPIVQELGGNAELKPEESRNFSAGVVISPRYVDGLRISLDWTRIRKKNNIFNLAPDQTVLDQEDLLPGIVKRAPPSSADPYAVGPITGFDSRWINGANAESVSYDLTVDYSISTGKYGEWYISTTGTKFTRLSRQLTPIAPSIEYAGTESSPTWAANAALGWSRGQWAGELRARYQDSFWLLTTHEIEINQGSATLPSQTYFDASLSYAFRESSDGVGRIFAQSDLHLGIQNLFNTKPRYYALADGLPDTRTDLSTASYVLRWRKSFF